MHTDYTVGADVLRLVDDRIQLEIGLHASRRADAVAVSIATFVVLFELFRHLRVIQIGKLQLVVHYVQGCQVLVVARHVIHDWRGAIELIYGIVILSVVWDVQVVRVSVIRSDRFLPFNPGKFISGFVLLALSVHAVSHTFFHRLMLLLNTGVWFHLELCDVNLGLLWLDVLLARKIINVTGDWAVYVFDGLRTLRGRPLLHGIMPVG